MTNTTKIFAEFAQKCGMRCLRKKNTIMQKRKASALSCPLAMSSLCKICAVNSMRMKRYYLQ